MLFLLATLCLGFASAATFTVVLTSGNVAMPWESTSTWGVKALPGLGDDVVLVVQGHCNTSNWLVLSSEVSVARVTLQADWSKLDFPCHASLVVAAGGWLQANVFEASKTAQLFLNRQRPSA